VVLSISNQKPKRGSFGYGVKPAGRPLTAATFEGIILQGSCCGIRHFSMNWFKSFWKALTEAAVSESREGPAVNNLTPRAQQVLALARKEADRFNHKFVGTEHVLLGLIALGRGVAVNVSRNLGLDLETIRQEVEKSIGTGPDEKLPGDILYTPRVKRVLVLAAGEAKALGHTYVGTEHILLGLLLEGDGVAARVLTSLNVDIAKIRQEILRELDPNA
jgi:hypothetical protein